MPDSVANYKTASGAFPMSAVADSPFAELYEPRDEEHAFAAQHGITLPTHIPREYLHIGTLPACAEHGRIKVEVLAFPARFFRFTIDALESEHVYVFETGSGAISRYLPLAMEVARGMFVPDSITSRTESTDESHG